MRTAARSYFWFLLVLLAAMLFAAIASPWVQWLLAPISAFPLHRVFSRLMLLGLIAGTAWLLIRHHRDRRALLGFQRPLPQFLQRVLAGWVAGIALMMLAVAPLVLLDLREWNARFPADMPGWVALACRAMGTGLVVALIEETLFRGAMQGALQAWFEGRFSRAEKLATRAYELGAPTGAVSLIVARRLARSMVSPVSQVMATAQWGTAAWVTAEIWLSNCSSNSR